MRGPTPHDQYIRYKTQSDMNIYVSGMIQYEDFLGGKPEPVSFCRFIPITEALNSPSGSNPGTKSCD
jgi:hypothetical protein